MLRVAPDDVSVWIAVLARLAAATATDEVTAACRELLANLRPLDLSHIDHSWDALEDLLTHLPSDLVEVALDLSSRLWLEDRCRVIRVLAPRLPKRLLANRSPRSKR